MKKSTFFLFFALIVFFFKDSQAQTCPNTTLCNAYVYTPGQPCEFIGSYYNDCGPSQLWTVENPLDNSILYSTSSSVFSYPALSFGLYRFRLQYQGDPYQECFEYTPCQPCGNKKLEVKYNSCPTGSCSMNVTASIDAINGLGVQSQTNILIYYTPSYNEDPSQTPVLKQTLLGTAYFNSSTKKLICTQDFQVNESRGCYYAVVRFFIINGAPKNPGELPACDHYDMKSTSFKCQSACGGLGGCQTSIQATQMMGDNPACCYALACNYGQLVPGETVPSACGQTGGRDSDFEVELANEPTEYKISPNPVTNLINITFPKVELEGISIKLISSSGEMVAKESAAEGAVSKTMDTSLLPAGIYFVVIESGGQLRYKEKVVVLK